MTTDTAMTKATGTDGVFAIIENLIVAGDLSALTPKQRVDYYMGLCEHAGLDWVTQPFTYIYLNGKLVLYANKTCTEQLRDKRGIAITSLVPQRFDDIYVVVASGKNREGREDSATGVVSIAGLRGEALANAMMKAETKAKRRLTLSLGGLALLDESEITEEIFQRANVDLQTGELKGEPPFPPAPPTDAQKMADLIARERTEWIAQIDQARADAKKHRNVTDAQYKLLERKHLGAAKLEEVDPAKLHDFLLEVQKYEPHAY